MKSALRWSGSLLLIAILAWRLDWSQVAACFARLHLGLWCLGLLLLVVSQLVSTIRWQILSGVLGFRGSYLRYVGIYHIGMFFNLMLPSSVGGDVVRIWYLAGMENTSPTGRRTLAALSVFVDRLNGLILLALVACLALVMSPIPLPGWIQLATLGVGAALAVGVLFLIVGMPIMRRLLPRVPHGIQVHLARLMTAMQLYLQHKGTLGIASLLSLVVQMLGVAIVWCVGLGLGLEVPLMCYGVVVPLAVLLTLLPISLNGMGLREAAFVLLLAPLGVGAAQAVALSFLYFLITVVCSLAGLGFYLLGRYPRYQPQVTTENDHDRPVRCDPDQGRTGQSATAA